MKPKGNGGGLAARAEILGVLTVAMFGIKIGY